MSPAFSPLSSSPGPKDIERSPLSSSPGPKDIERSKLHAELAAAGFELRQHQGVFTIYQTRSGKPFVEGINLPGVLAAYRANLPRVRRAA